MRPRDDDPTWPRLSVMPPRERQYVQFPLVDPMVPVEWYDRAVRQADTWRRAFALLAIWAAAGWALAGVVWGLS